MSDRATPGKTVIHELVNHLSIIAGFADLVLESMPDDDPRHADLMEVRNAARAAITLIPDLTKQLK